jgi:cell division protein DivIC
MSVEKTNKSRITILKEKKYIKFFRNKYNFTFSIFFIYALFLDDVDIFKLISQNRKLNRIENNQAVMQDKLRKTKNTLKQLNNSHSLERFAREQKFFKKDNEDVFIISNE